MFKLLFAPITLPASGVRFLMETVQTMAEQELYDMAKIREDLVLLQLKLEEGDITEDEYVVQEADVMVRLREAREYWKNKGQ